MATEADSGRGDWRIVEVQGGDRPGGEPLPAARAVTPIYDWTGFYVGGHVAYRRGRMSDTLNDSISVNGFGSLYGGVQLGYNYMLPSRLLLGIEADISFPSFLEDGVAMTGNTAAGSVVRDKVDYVGTVRGRIGYVVGRWLLYGTGGFAYSGARFLEDPGVERSEDKIIRTRFGWVAGVGAEVAIAPAWTARLEYLYDQYGRASGAFPSGTRYESDFDSHTVRVALNRQLGWPGSPPPASPAGGWLPSPDSWNIHGQATFIGQGYPAFRSPYQGANSLFGGGQYKNTTSATAFIGFRPWDGTEIYIDPEFMQGFGLSNTFGVAGFPNGEAQKSNFPMPRFNIARVFVRQTFGLGGEQETIEDGPNQLAGTLDISRITLVAGKLAVIDYFDINAYANDPRTDFMNWNVYGGGSYDLTMDKLSYTWGGLAELNQERWAVRVGYFLVPTVSNVNTFDTHIPSRGEYIGEFEWRYAVVARPGKLRLMGWANRANAGSYSEAIALPVASPNYPDITQTRQTRTNYGFVVNVEQAVTEDLGLFSRASWDAGQTEKIGWTDCDESLSLGASLKGTVWGRPNDKIGVAGVIEGLSREARDFFGAGGLGILIGDGRLNYREEKILETYYACALTKWATLTFDYQYIVNPAYNADRGPVSVFSGRLHLDL